MATKQIKIEKLKVGDRFWKHGILWIALEVKWDQRGNAQFDRPDQPRWLVRVQATPGKWGLPDDGQGHLGFLPDTEVTVEEGGAA